MARIVKWYQNTVDHSKHSAHNWDLDFNPSRTARTNSLLWNLFVFDPLTRRLYLTAAALVAATIDLSVGPVPAARSLSSACERWCCWEAAVWKQRGLLLEPRLPQTEKKGSWAVLWPALLTEPRIMMIQQASPCWRPSQVTWTQTASHLEFKNSSKPVIYGHLQQLSITHWGSWYWL